MEGCGGAAARLGAGVVVVVVGRAAAALDQLQRRLALVQLPAGGRRVRVLLALTRAARRPYLTVLRR